MIILFIFISLAFSKPLTQHSVELAIDCGATSTHQAKEGYYYQEDQYFFGQSRVADYTYNEIVMNGLKYTLNPKVYFTERHGEGFGYRLPLKNGRYTIILQFVELYFTDENERQFDIFIGSRRILHNFSIIDSIFKQGATKEEYIPIEIKENKVYFRDKECEDGYLNNQVILKFEQGAADLPKVDGIIVVKGYEADQDEKKYLVEEWDSILEESENQKKEKEEEIKKQTNPNQNVITEELVEEKGESLIEFMLSPLGLCIVGVIAGFLVCINLVDTKSKKQ